MPTFRKINGNVYRRNHPSFVEFTSGSAQTYTLPPTTKSATILVVGGGGSGGGGYWGVGTTVTPDTQGGAGGGGGGYAYITNVTLTPGSSITYTVGPSVGGGFATAAGTAQTTNFGGTAGNLSRLITDKFTITSTGGGPGRSGGLLGTAEVTPFSGATAGTASVTSGSLPTGSVSVLSSGGTGGTSSAYRNWATSLTNGGNGRNDFKLGIQNLGSNGGAASANTALSTAVFYSSGTVSTVGFSGGGGAAANKAGVINYTTYKGSNGSFGGGGGGGSVSGGTARTAGAGGDAGVNTGGGGGGGGTAADAIKPGGNGAAGYIALVIYS